MRIIDSLCGSVRCPNVSCDWSIIGYNNVTIDADDCAQQTTLYSLRALLQRGSLTGLFAHRNPGSTFEKRAYSFTMT